MLKWIGTLEWSQRNVTLHDVPFRASDYPWLTDIAETIDRVRGGKFILLFPPQVFKSLFKQLRIARNVAVEPSPHLWYSKTSAEAGAFSDTKLSRLLEASQAIRMKRYFDPDERGGKTLMKWPDMTLEMLGADVKNHRQSKSGRDMFFDEAWQYESGAIEEIFKRSNSYETSRRIVIGMTGPEVEHETDVLWNRSTKAEWRVACPSCSAVVPCEFGDAESAGGLKWDSNETTREPDGRWRVDDAAATTVWVCPACRERHKYTPQLQRAMSDPSRGAGYEVTNQKAAARIYGWHAEASVFRNWNDSVAEFLTAQNSLRLGSVEQLADFVQKNQCRAWDISKTVKQNKTIPFGDYMMGDKWDLEGVCEDGIPLRIMTCDVQKDHYWVVIRQWSNKPGSWAHSRLLYFSKAVSPSEIEDIRIQFGVHPKRVTMDCKAYDQAVYQICHRYDYLAFAGVDVRNNSFNHEDGVRRIYDKEKVMDAYAGKAEAGWAFASRIQFSSIAAKFRLEMLRSTKSVDGKPVWTVPANAPNEYLKQAWGEIMVRRRNPKGGMRTEFIEVGPNHAFDMESVQCVCASMLKVLGSEAMVGQDGEEADPDQTVASAA